MSYGQQPGGPYGRPPYQGQYGGQPQYGPPPPYNAPPPQYAPPQQYDPYADVPVQGRRRRAEAPIGGPVTDEDERWAVPAYVGMFVSGFVAPAIVLAAKGRTSPFARFHAVQALNLFVVAAAGMFVAMLLTYFKGPGWLPLVFAVLAADCFVVVKAAIGANRCEWYRLPAIVAWRIFR
ncbi:DUF4870 domain-containing protein [Actinomadura sp. DC4]|uniref:DUF4870 domain-containing protein n=1 Tax=Actinomadura sp. DC4 TaxID=3055069 RepID=UPI0025B03A51|nr:DUF4870 domain-containing protein [Actinomadura sp. DC4]MDN3353474.1 DUF4870 domain-containing protein [Actinomadura sp. DC4]